MTTAPAPHQTVALTRNWWWGFVPFAALSAVHVGARLAEADAIAGPTKLVLMPLLAAAAVWGLRRQLRRAPSLLLLAAVFFSWIGDGAGAFFPQAPELPVMLASFGIAHLFYIRLLWKYAARGPFPRWALVFPLWWLLMFLLLWPTLGTLAAAVMAYGLVLGSTAAVAARCNPVIAGGGLLFLASDTVLALRIFLPEAMPAWTSALVMLTYCAGQGLIVAGFLRGRRVTP